MKVDDGTVPLEDLVAAVKKAVSRAGISATAADRDLRVSSVQLIVNTVAAAKVGGGLNLRVPVIGWKIKAGGSHRRQRTHTVDLTLAPPPRDTPSYEVRDGRVEQALIDAITGIRAVTAAAAAGDDPFLLQSGTIQLIFAVTDQGAISLGAEGEAVDEVTHTLKLTLERAAAAHSAATPPGSP